MTLTVVKVGGGLLGGCEDLERVARSLAARRQAGERLLVVVSALHGVTDMLESAAEAALDPRAGGELERAVTARLQRRHDDAAGLDAEAARLGVRLAIDGVGRLLTGIRLTGELTDRTRALLLAHGERLAAPIVASALIRAGVDARAVHSEEGGLVARGHPLTGGCDLVASEAGAQSLAHELHDRVLVLTGFYARDPDGDVVLFGRGGTDYTAGVMARLTSADALELWKDVPGFMTTDPRGVEAAHLVPELSFDEACELGYYGARILHPRCLEPLRGHDVAVSVRPVEGEVGCGTAVVEAPERDGVGVAALAHRQGVALVRCSSPAMVNQPGVAGRILSAVGAAGVNVDALAASMTSVSFTCDEVDAALVRRTLKLLASEESVEVEQVEVLTGVALLGLVGDGVAKDASIAARALSCLAELGFAVDLISHGPGDVGMSCVVPSEDLPRALAALHRAFFEVGELSSR